MRRLFGACVRRYGFSRCASDEPGNDLLKLYAYYRILNLVNFVAFLVFQIIQHSIKLTLNPDTPGFSYLIEPTFCKIVNGQMLTCFGSVAPLSSIITVCPSFVAFSMWHCHTITKTHLFKYIENFYHPKTESFQIKILIFFLFLFKT